MLYRFLSILILGLTLSLKHAAQGEEKFTTITPPLTLDLKEETEEDKF